MEQATAIIGAAFGDEGKGLMTDFICSRLDSPLVVRFNGGAQAGHTVCALGQRHVFAHWGAGTFAGAETYLGPDFIINPMLWLEERNDLLRLRDVPRLMMSAHRLCRVSTPWDVLINQTAEDAKGANRHGSCGTGIHATMERCEHEPVDLRLWHLMTYDRHELQMRCLRIAEAAADVLKGLGGGEVELRLCHSPLMRELFIDACAVFANAVRGRPIRALPASMPLVFEGAQGLLLHQDHEFFPHVTHSRTGLEGVIHIACQTDVKRLEVIYVLRSYMTRHGAGPFPTVDADLKFYDNTNLPNPYQGELRFGRLDYDLIETAIQEDLMHTWGTGLEIEPCFAITHVDQHQPDLERLSSILPVRYIAAGPNRKDVTEVKPC